MKIALIVLALACIAYYFYNNANNQKAAGLNQEKGSAFLAENSKKDGVKTTASGLQYEVLQSGNGESHPTASSTVRVHYHGTLIDGTVFDSSVERGETISFPLNRVIPGWTEGVQLMKVGDKFRFFIPSNLGYGSRSAGKIPAGSTLIFDVELFEIQ
jgi:peptidylprolyl isomerase